MKKGPTKGVFVEPIQYAARDDKDSKAKGIQLIPVEGMGCINIDFDLDTEEERRWLAEAMTVRSRESTRFKGNPVYHVSISWPEGEHPSRDQCEKTAHHFMKGLGMEENEAFWAIHRDTDHDHFLPSDPQQSSSGESDRHGAAPIRLRATSSIGA
ncbi:MAG: relaxase/mobilization nuclease domain-containing protein [Thiomonas sp.]